MEDVPGSTTSSYTRPPAYWDMHLTEDLILKKIVHMPFLPEALMALVDDAIAELRDADMLDDLEDVLELLNDRVATVPCVARDEAEVVAFYEKTTGHVCPYVASRLEFGPTTHSLLDWTNSRRHGGNAEPVGESAKDTGASKRKTAKGSKEPDDTPVSASAKAVADGFLRFFFSSKTFEDDLLNLPPDKQKDFEAIRTHFVNLAVWEFKNLVAGNENTMKAIGALAGKPFCWEKCSEENLCSNAKHLEMSGRPKVTRVRTGPDATETPWTLSDSIVSDMADEHILSTVAEISKHKSRKRKGKEVSRNTTKTTPAQVPNEVKARWIIQQVCCCSIPAW